MGVSCSPLHLLLSVFQRRSFGGGFGQPGIQTSRVDVFADA
jgi:hypothetical protein